MIYLNRTQYGLYQDPVLLCKTTDMDKWKNAIYWVFDAPDIANKQFEVEFFF